MRVFGEELDDDIGQNASMHPSHVNGGAEEIGSECRSTDDDNQTLEDDCQDGEDETEH